MPQISAIEPQKRKKGRFNIYLDGEFAFGVGENLIVRENLKIGKNLPKEEINRLVEESGIEKILEKVFKFLSFRPRSKKEILDYLKRKNLGKNESELALKRVEKLGFINDEEFARFLVQSRVKSKPKGKRVLILELRQKGIDNEIIEKILDEVTVSELELAQRAISKKLENFLKLPPNAAREKITAYLGRRGFSWDTIKELIDTASPSHD